MSIRQSTKVQDRAIRKLDRAGTPPKMIRDMLGLSSVWVVYDTRRRRLISQNSPKFAKSKKSRSLLN
jgi:hypothetical protein